MSLYVTAKFRKIAKKRNLAWEYDIGALECFSHAKTKSPNTSMYDMSIHGVGQNLEATF